MKLNAERRNQIKKEVEKMYPTTKKNNMNDCFFHAKYLKKVTPRTFSCWKVDATIT